MRMSKKAEKKRQFTKRSTALQVVEGLDLSGKTYLVTGGNGGIGFETCRALASRGAHVVMLCRESQKTEDAKNRIIKEFINARVDVIPVDFTNLKSVHTCAEIFKHTNWRLDCLILNAGVWEPNPRVTNDGFEATFQVNYLAQFELTKDLLTRLEQSAPARVVVVSSEYHRHCCSHNLRPQNITWEFLSPTDKKKLNSAKNAYIISKTCSILFAAEMNRRYHGRGILVNSCHPGLVKTDVMRNAPRSAKCMYCCLCCITKNPEQGAATQTYLATAPELDGVGGQYYLDFKPKNPDSCARNEESAKKLWELSEQMLQEEQLRTVALNFYNKKTFFQRFLDRMKTSPEEQQRGEKTVEKYRGHQVEMRTGLGTGLRDQQLHERIRQWHTTNLMSEAQQRDLIKDTENLTEVIKDYVHDTAKGEGVWGLVGVRKEIDNTHCLAYAFAEFKFQPGVSLKFTNKDVRHSGEAGEPLLSNKGVTEVENEISKEDMANLLNFVKWKTDVRFEGANGEAIRKVDAEADQYIARLPEHMRQEILKNQPPSSAKKL